MLFLNSDCFVHWVYFCLTITTDAETVLLGCALSFGLEQGHPDLFVCQVQDILSYFFDILSESLFIYVSFCIIFCLQRCEDTTAVNVCSPSQICYLKG